MTTKQLKKLISASLFGVSIIAISIMVDGRTNSAGAVAVCSNQVISAKARGLGRERAKKNVRSAWETKAKSFMRTNRANWWNGIDRSYSCWYVGAFRYECTGWAKPCV